MEDRYDSLAAGLESPAIDGFAITPSDSAELPELTRALYVGAGGTVVAVMQSGVEISFANLGSGTLLPVRLRRVMATGTTAGALVGML